MLNCLLVSSRRVFYETATSRLLVVFCWFSVDRIFKDAEFQLSYFSVNFESVRVNISESIRFEAGTQARKYLKLTGLFLYIGPKLDKAGNAADFLALYSMERLIDQIYFFEIF